MKHYVLLGIEHLMTGVMLRCGTDADTSSTITFERESASIIRASADTPIEVYWPVTQAWITSTEVAEIEHAKYSHGEVEHYAKKVAEVLRDVDTRSMVDMQTYTRKQDYCHAGDKRIGPNEPTPFPWAVVKAMRRKHGAEADKFLAMLRWDRDHWYYIRDSMYIGVETDGYIHT